MSSLARPLPSAEESHTQLCANYVVSGGKKEMGRCSSGLAIAERSVKVANWPGQQSPPSRVFIFPVSSHFFRVISRLSLSDLLVWAGGKEFA